MKKTFLIATAMSAFFTVSSVQAADLGLAPASVTMRVATGESGSTTVVGNVNNPPASGYTIALQLLPAGGSMPPGWLSTQPATLTNRTVPALLPLTVRVPQAAAPGTYLALVQPVVLASSIPLVSPARPLQLSVIVASRCAGTPAVAVASAQPAEFAAPNGRLEDVSVTGTVTLPDGCTLAGAWYTLEDEYRVLGETRDITVATGGSFSFAVPVQVSRLGEDKDGRTYRFTVYAADEAGTGASAPAVIVVRHDQRKEK